MKARAPSRWPLLLPACLYTAAALGQPVPEPEPEAGSEPTAGRHPLLTSRFVISAGAFWPQKAFELGAGGALPGDDIDFDKTFRFEDASTTAFGNFRWRFSDNWSLGVEGWKLDSSGGAILTEDVVWDDLVFREGSFATAGVDLKLVRVFLGRKLWHSDTYETGVGVGAHWMEINAFIEGEVRVDEEATGIQKGDVGTEFPLPNIGFWYLQALSPRWAASVRVDWLSAGIDRYSGQLWNAQAGVHFQAAEHVGLSLSATYFELDGRITDDDWRGQAELTQYGPKASLYVTF